ncbi:DUF4296 domain-containing protein [uncultured Flavobacterium sp.]|uniref:DUF4296 domain-containing protein n=1 Tax=uncultured Flavobacterium sp. TaxID=165435 RepID=UPI0030C80D3F
MKKLVFLFISIIFLSCNNKPVSKPDNLLSKEVMEDIIFDLAILQAAETYMPQKLSDKKIVSEEYIYKKYEIDSATYFQNYKYYASDIKNFKKIYKKVNDRINENKIRLDTVSVNRVKPISTEQNPNIPQTE